jgi:hypothetical protein
MLIFFKLQNNDEKKKLKVGRRILILILLWDTIFCRLDEEKKNQWLEITLHYFKTLPCQTCSDKIFNIFFFF